MACRVLTLALLLSKTASALRIVLALAGCAAERQDTVAADGCWQCRVDATWGDKQHDSRKQPRGGRAQTAAATVSSWQLQLYRSIDRAGVLMSHWQCNALACAAAVGTCCAPLHAVEVLRSRAEKVLGMMGVPC